MQFSGEHGSKCKAWFKKKVLFRSSQTWTWRNANWTKDIKAEAHNCPKGLLTFFLLWLELLSLEAFVIVSAKSKPLFDRDLIEKRPQSRTTKIELVKIEITGADLVEPLIKILGLKPNRSSWLILLLFLSGRFFPNPLIQQRKERFWFEILRIADSS